MDVSSHSGPQDVCVFGGGEEAGVINHGDVAALAGDDGSEFFECSPGFHCLTEHLLRLVLVFGDGASDERLVKCGVRFKLQKAQIVQGAMHDTPMSKSVDVEAPLGETFDLVVRVNPSQRTVTLTTAGVTLEAKLAAPLESITHIGFGADSAMVEFAPLEVSR